MSRKRRRTKSGAAAPRPPQQQAQPAQPDGLVDGSVSSSELVAVKEHYYSGPLPTPEIFKQYREIIPDLPKKIVDMWESEVRHNHTLVSKVFDAEAKDQQSARAEMRIGQFLAFLICALLIGVAGFFGWLGYPWPGVVISSGTMVSLATAFMKRRATG